MKSLLLFLLITSLLVAAEPLRNGGLSVHLLPDRVAKLSGERGGFTVTDPATRNTGGTYGDPKAMLAYFRHLPAATQQNGIWIVTTHPSSYSEAEQTRLKALVALCTAQGIPIYTCRGSELPNGWKFLARRQIADRHSPLHLFNDLQVERSRITLRNRD